MTVPDQRAKNVRSQPPRSVPPGTDQEKSADAGQPPAKDSHAVALSYRPDDPDAAPRIVASGSGFKAEEILKLAFAHGTPVREDPDLLSLLKTAEIGDEIPIEAFIAVAEILRYVYALNGTSAPVAPEE